MIERRIDLKSSDIKKKNEFESVELKWVNLEPVIEWSQKNKYHINTYVESRKMVQMNLFEKQK